MSGQDAPSNLALTGLLVGVVVPLVVFAFGAAMGRLFGWTRQNKWRRLVVIVPLLGFYLYQAWSSYVQHGLGWSSLGLAVAGLLWAALALSHGLHSGAQQAGSAP